MCGINGIFAYNASAGAPDHAELIATRDHMAARGPDGDGQWWSEDARTGLGHRRLSIIDLNDRALQPMASADGRFVIVFNGEIYNYASLRSELEREGRVFRTTSDTEVILHLFDRDGPRMVKRLRGMFAIAIWDALQRRLFLARDPYGIKPLYTANDGWTFRFASQVKALLAGGGVSKAPEPAGIVGFHLWGSVPEPFTLYRDIRALPAGHTQVIDEVGPRDPQPFASISETLAGRQRLIARAEETKRTADEIRSTLLDSVRAHLVADVEVGLFLSAGVDSGALLGLMRDVGRERVRAVTLAFEEFRGTSEDEAPLAAEIAALYGAEHIVRTVSKREFENSIPTILEQMDQPSIDGVNTWFVAQAAREAGLKVALSGLGGDELLGGYSSFQELPLWVSLLAGPSSLPGAGALARRLMAAAGFGARNPKLLGLVEYGGNYPGAYLLRRALFLPFELDTLLDRDVVREGLSRLQPLRLLAQSLHPDPRAPIARVAALESANYLRNQLLRDADWAGMAHSLEIRTPLVDFNVLCALAPIIPQLSASKGKRFLANAPSTPLPESVLRRDKTGFGVPTGEWVGAKESKGAASRAWSRRVFNPPPPQSLAFGLTE